MKADNGKNNKIFPSHTISLTKTTPVKNRDTESRLTTSLQPLSECIKNNLCNFNNLKKDKIGIESAM